MTIQELQDIVSTHNLVIRYIPKEVVGTYHMRHHKEGNKIVVKNGLEYTQEITIPKNAGKYVATRNDVGFYGDTIEDAVNQFLNTLEKK